MTRRDRMMRACRAIAIPTLAALCAHASPAWSAACSVSPFDDVLASATYCTNTQWLANRGITVGCTPDGQAYCPNDAVTRAQMALFMNRMAVALSPTYAQKHVTAANYAPTLGGNHECVVTVAAADYPRRVSAYGGAMFNRPSDNMDVRAFVQGKAISGYSQNGLTAIATLNPGQATTLPAFGTFELPANYVGSYTINVSQTRAEDDATVQLFYCDLTVRVDNANGTNAPF